MADDSSAYIVGAVGVSVEPAGGDTFFDKFAAQAAPGADKAGKTLGDTVAKPLSDKVAGGVGDGIDKGGRQAAPRSTKAGDDSGGKFADAFKRRVEAALKALPDAKITGDSSDAERKIADLRASLAELSNKRVGVDIDEAAAIAELARLRGELDELGQRSPSIQVRTDTAAASAELAIVQAQVDKVAADSPTIKVDVDAAGAEAELAAVDGAASGSVGSLGALATAGVLLGPAIIPVAAAAAAAIAGIGAAAGGALAGFGVVALAVAPVIGAVQAMGAAQKSAATSATTLASRQASLAGAADQVKSAQASLANATANAAESQRRAAETVANAEISLSDAQRQAQQAQVDLTNARRSEIQAEQDLANSIADGALAQRQALIDVQNAKANLDKVLANPASTQLQRQQAQLTYDQAVQQITDLGVRQQRLVAQQTQNTKTGVDGSSQVVTAQDKVRQSQEQVAKAEQALADARIAAATQARQSAFSIAQAQQGVITAQRAVQTASVQASTAGGAAADTLRQKLAALTPEGQKFATFLFGLKPVLNDLSGAAQRGFLPGAQEGIQALLPLVPSLTAGIGKLAGTVGGLAAEGGHLIASPFFTGFFKFLGGEANSDVVIITHTLEKFAIGTAGLIQGLAPLSHLILNDVEGWTTRFAHFGATIGSNQQFQTFILYTERELPKVITTLDSLAGATGHLVVAAAPVGGVVLQALRLVSDAIRAIPTPVLTILVGAVVAVTAATKAYALVQGLGITETKAWALAQSGAAFAATAVKGAYAAAAVETTGFNAAMAAGQSAAGSLKNGVSGLVGLLGGPLGIAALAATAALVITTTAIVQQRQRVTDLSKAMLSLHDALNQTGTANSDTIKSIVDGNADLQKAIRFSDQYGLSADSVVAALKGQKSAQDDVTNSLKAKIAADGQATKALIDAKPANQDEVKSNSARIKALQDSISQEKLLLKALGQTYSQIGANADVNAILDGAQNKTTGSSTKLTAAQTSLGDALNKVADSSATADDKVNALKAAQTAIYGAAQNAADAEEAYYASVDNTSKVLAENSKAIADNKGKLDLHTQAGRNDTDAIKEQLKASNDMYFADVASGKPIEEATAKHDARTLALIKEATQDGVNKGAVQGLVDIYGQVPSDVSTVITVTGVSQALTQLEQLQIAQLALKQGIPVDQAAKEYQKQHAAATVTVKGISKENLTGVGGLAVGGPVVGPGGPTADQVRAVMPWGPGVVPFRLSNGEHVWTAAEVAAAGGHAAVEALRKSVLKGKSPAARFPGDGSQGIAFAQGGAVSWPFPVTAAITRIPSLAEVQSVVTAQQVPGLDSQVTAASPQIASVQAWIRAQAGKPYIWDAAGPRGFDCSGLVSAVFNALHGRSINVHTFSTSNEAGYFPLAGPGTFTAGWAGPGQRGGGSVGHTAGVLGGLPFESRGGDGVVVGHGVTPVTSFAHIGHYDDGGYLPPGLSMNYNGTGRPEPVLTDEQWQAIGAGAKGGDGGGSPFNIEHYHEAAGGDPFAVATELDWMSRTRGR